MDVIWNFILGQSYVISGSMDFISKNNHDNDQSYFVIKFMISTLFLSHEKQIVWTIFNDLYWT